MGNLLKKWEQAEEKTSYDDESGVLKIK